MGIPFNQDSALFSLTCLGSPWEILPHKAAVKNWQLIFEKVDLRDIISMYFYEFPKILPLDRQSANLTAGLNYSSFQGAVSAELVFTVCPWSYSRSVLGITINILGMNFQSVQYVVNTARKQIFFNGWPLCFQLCCVFSHSLCEALSFKERTRLPEPYLEWKTKLYLGYELQGCLHR